MSKRSAATTERSAAEEPAKTAPRTQYNEFKLVFSDQRAVQKGVPAMNSTDKAVYRQAARFTQPLELDVTKSTPPK